MVLLRLIGIDVTSLLSSRPAGIVVLVSVTHDASTMRD